MLGVEGIVIGGVVGMSSGSGKDSTAAARQPIAIVGIGCRFPGASSPQQFWQLLVDGADAVGEIMPQRWDDGRWYHANKECLGRVYTKSAGKPCKVLD